MAITKADVLTEVQNRTNRTDLTAANLKDKLESVLLDISSRHPFLEKTVYLTNTISEYNPPGGAETDWYVLLPSDYREVISVFDKRDSSPVNYIYQLKRVSMAELAAYVNASPGADHPERFAVLNTEDPWIYFHPRPSATSIFKMFYSYQVNNEDNIGYFPDCFKEAIIEGCCWKVEEGLGMQGKVESTLAFKQNYEEQIAVLMRRYIDRIQPRS